MRATSTASTARGRASDALDLVLADEHRVFLDGLTAILTRSGHRVLASVPTLTTLHERVRTLRPDVCLIEADTGDQAGLDTIALLTYSCPGTRVVVLTGSAAPEMQQKSLAAGASGFVHKTRDLDVVLDVLRRVAAGEIATEASFLRPPRKFDARHPQRVAHYLTPRERECLTLLTAGQDTVTMAGSLGVSVTTVRSHVQSLLSKLGVHSRLEAASLAVRCRLVEPYDVGHPMAAGRAG